MDEDSDEAGRYDLPWFIRDDEPAPADSIVNMDPIDAAFQAWKNGTSHPDDEGFEAVWSGIVGRGYTGRAVAQRLEDLRSMIALIDAGASIDEVDPPHVYGNTIETVYEQVQASISMFEQAQLCHGRNLAANEVVVLQERWKRAGLDI